jgi:hypothetical protein
MFRPDLDKLGILVIWALSLVLCGAMIMGIWLQKVNLAFCLCIFSARKESTRQLVGVLHSRDPSAPLAGTKTRPFS